MRDIYQKGVVEGPRRYQSFFTEAEDVNKLMISLLGDVRRAKILEPCAGHGAFVKPLLHEVTRIDAIDIDSAHVRELNSLNTTRLCVQQGDFIDHFVSGELISPLSIGTDYDAVICNPPYGLRFSIPYRKTIKARFPQLYARESYGLFMVFALRCLKDGGRFVFIVPDTFLTSRNHRSLRTFLLDHTNITHLVQFDSSRFGTINFGYGSLCVISGTRSSIRCTHCLLWLDLRGSEEPLTLSAFDGATRLSPHDLTRSPDLGWAPSNQETWLPAQSVLLGEIADCRTGIYTGDNPRFCAYDEHRPPARVNGHPISWSQVRSTGAMTRDERENGFSDPPSYVPLVRGGHRLPFASTTSAINWSRTALNQYRNNKKARLQNLRFYFRAGLAVPMVTSGRLSASYIDGAVFDQGVVGIFPKSDRWIPFLLVFLNSAHATRAKRGISPGANNSANYVKRLQIPVPTEAQLKEAVHLCTRWKDAPIIDTDAVRTAATAYIAHHFTSLDNCLGQKGLTLDHSTIPRKDQSRSQRYIPE